MQTVAQLRASLEIDDARFVSGIRRANEELEKTENQAKKTGSAFDNMSSKLDRLRGMGAALSIGVTLPLAAASVASIKFASDLNESLSKSSVVFGDSANSIKQWSQTAVTSLGMTQQQAVESAATIGNLIVSLGLGSDKAAGMSKSIIQLSADLASFNNVNPEDAFQAIRSGLVGETEPLRRFGVNLNEATIQTEALKMGLISSTKDAVTPAIRAQAAYALIMEQTKTAQGDFARTSGGLANQTRELQAAFKQLLTDLGTQFLPVATRLTHWGIQTIQQFEALPPEAKNVALTIAGITAAIGPLLLGISGAVRLFKEAREGWRALVDLKDLVVAAWTAKTAAVTAHAAALEADTAAQVANNAAQGAGAGMGAAGLLRGAGAIGAAGAVAVGGWAVGSWLHDTFVNPTANAVEEERRRRLEASRLRNDPIELQRYQNTPFYNRPAVAAQIQTLMRQGMSRAEAEQEVSAARRGGQERIDTLTALQSGTLGQLNRPNQLQGADLAKVQDAQFAAQIESARASVLGAPENRRAQAEAARLIPELKQRTAQLQERAKAMGDVSKLSADDQVKYYQLQRDIAQTETEGVQLQNAANKEREENQNKANEAAKRLQQQQKEQWQKYQQAVKEYMRQQQEIANLRKEAELGAIQVEVNSADENEQAARAAELLIPRLRNHLQQVMDSLRRQSPATKEYWENANDIVKTEQDIQKVQADASKERADNLNRLQQEQERAQEQQRRAFQTVTQNRGLRTSLTEAMLRNNPFLNDAQRQQLLVPSLVREYRGLAIAAPGEDETGSLQRQIQQQGVLGRIFETLGITGRNARGMPNPRALNALMSQLNAPPTRDEARQLAKATAGDKPVVFQITLAPKNPEELRREFERFWSEAEKRFFPTPYPTQ